MKIEKKILERKILEIHDETDRVDIGESTYDIEDLKKIVIDQRDKIKVPDEEIDSLKTAPDLWKDEKWRIYGDYTNEEKTHWWEKYRNINTIEVSNYGRIRVNGKINSEDIELIESFTYEKIYQIVAKTWLSCEHIKEKCQNKTCQNEKCQKCTVPKNLRVQIHHINNDPRDSRVKNLIWINACDHHSIPRQ